MQASLPWARPSISIEVPEWARAAACRNLTPEEADALFFPERGHSTVAGRALCGRCPVTLQCLDMALSTAVEFGIFGGTSLQERRCLTRAAGTHVRAVRFV